MGWWIWWRGTGGGGRHREGAETGSWSWRGLGWAGGILCWDGKNGPNRNAQKQTCALDFLLCVRGAGVEKVKLRGGWMGKPNAGISGMGILGFFLSREIELIGGMDAILLSADTMNRTG